MGSVCRYVFESTMVMQVRRGIVRLERQEAMIVGDRRETKGLPGQGVVLGGSDRLGINRARERKNKKKQVRSERESERV